MRCSEWSQRGRSDGVSAFNEPDASDQLFTFHHTRTRWHTMEPFLAHDAYTPQNIALILLRALNGRAVHFEMGYVLFLLWILKEKRIV